MRAIQIVVALAALVMLCVPWLRRAPHPAGRSVPAPTDELVKDPVCQTYVVRSRAIARPGPEGPRYFCSDVCARRDA
jgi:predicted cobalt transporter CbtA